MEQVSIISHLCHEHPLRLLTYKYHDEETQCCLCQEDVVVSELAYICSIDNQCSSRIILHKRCAEMPRQIEHPSHPQHSLSLCLDPYGPIGFVCNLCGHYFYDSTFCYHCYYCKFDIDISCKQLGMDNYLLQGQKLPHPCHDHPLTLQRKLTIFFCDGCGTSEGSRDMAYICSTCEFWVHKSCASLPSTIKKKNYHHHPLSLAFSFPLEHRKYKFSCDICHGPFCPTYWVYYCDLCRFFAHVKCATGENIPTQFNLNVKEDDDSSVIELPVNDFSKELIAPFIIRQEGSLPAEINDMPTSVTMPATSSKFSILFNYHKHPLSLIKVDDGDGDGDKNEAAELMICDLCITPVLSPPYYGCAECKYFVHLTCYMLPKTLCHDPLNEYDQERHQHKFTLYSPKVDGNLLFCSFCHKWTNGIAYHCQDCDFTIDVNCLTLPTIIKMASHRNHTLIIMKRSPEFTKCDVCDAYIFGQDILYSCNNSDCEFNVHCECALLPRSIKHRWDRHPLLLINDAHIDHPSDFYCDACEKEMHPKRGMYHCRECDQSFHIHCLTESGENRNIKFGHQFEFGHLHPHPPKYNLVSCQLKCDRCGETTYQRRGFECVSCNYALCERCVISAQ